MSFRLRTVLGIALIEAVLLALLVWTSLDYLRTSNEEELSKRAHTVARLFATTTQNAVLASDLASLEVTVHEMLRNPGVEYARVRGRGDVVLAEAGDPEGLLRLFRADGAVDPDGDAVLDVFEDLVIAGTAYGRVEVGLSTGALRELLAEARHRAGVIALIEMGLVALFSFALGTYLTRELARLRQASHRVAAGELGYRIETRGHDELADTVRAFNDMSGKLETAAAERQRAEAELTRYREHLELLVAQRTEELTQANETLREANRQLAEAERMASLGQLAAGVAHEINNPLGFVSSNLGSLEGYLCDLLRVVDAWERHGDALSATERAAMVALCGETDLDFVRKDAFSLLAESREGLQRVKRIVQDLRDFSSVDQQGWQLADIHQGLEAALDLVQGELGQAQVIKAFGPLPPVECLRSELNRAFMNLLLNAAQAVAGQGTVTVATRVADEGVRVEIGDTGCGIHADDLKRIFDPFFTTRPVGEGAGLGLSIAYGIVRRHHGRLCVESEPGHGSTFRLWLPLRQPERACRRGAEAQRE